MRKSFDAFHLHAWRTRRPASILFGRVHLWRAVGLDRRVPWRTALTAFVLVVFATVAGADSPMPPVAATSSVYAAGGAMTALPGQPAAPAAGMTIQQAWQNGGFIMWLLALMAGAGVVLFIRQLPVSSAQQVVPRGLLAEMLDRIRAGELNEARRLCEDRPCPLTVIALKAFDHLRNAPKAGVALLRDTVEAEGARQADMMLSQAQLMLDIAVIAPMFGLLGTVLGLMQGVGSASADMGIVRVAWQAGGILQALATTAFGLLVAIPAMVCYAWMRRRVARRIAALESAAAEIVMAVVGRYDR